MPCASALSALRLPGRAILGGLLTLPLTLSLAAPSTAHAGATVGQTLGASGVVLGGEAVGALGGALIGLAASSGCESQDGSDACASQTLGGAAVGFGAGLAVGGVAAAPLGALVANARPLRTLGIAASGAAVGVGSYVLLSRTNATLANTGAVAAVLGAPVATAIAVVTDKEAGRKGEETARLHLTPSVRRDRAGLVLSGRF